MSRHRVRSSLAFSAGSVFALVALPLAVAPLAFSACSSSNDSPAAAQAPDATDNDANDAAPSNDSSVIPFEASTVHCTLFDGTDPVGLCAQKIVLRTMHSVFTDKGGVPARWDSHTAIGARDDAGNTAHESKDDIAFGAELSRYYVNSIAYGDEELTPIAYTDLPRIATLVEAELASLPATYDGEVYRNLRYLAIGLRYVDSNDHATKIDGVADAYGAALFTTYYHRLALANGDGGAGDGGVESLEDGILGTAAAGGAFAYDAADAVTGAFALMDMALNHPKDASSSSAWQAASLAVVDHVWRRARHAPTGMTYRSLVTSDDPAGDSPRSADLTADVQATIALALLRMLDLTPADAGATPLLAHYPLSAHAISAVASLHGTSGLWDDAGIGTFAAYSLDGGVVDTTKPTRANALLLGAMHRSFGAVGSTTSNADVAALFKRLASTTVGDPGFLTVIVDQAAFFDAVASDFHLVDGGVPPYSAAATAAACDGLNEQGAPIPGAIP